MVTKLTFTTSFTVGTFKTNNKLSILTYRNNVNTKFRSQRNLRQSRTPGTLKIELQYAKLEYHASLSVNKPRVWDGYWRLVSYDIPADEQTLRTEIKKYLVCWGFYQLHESVYLHAYPCEKQVEYLRSIFGAGKYLRIFKVVQIENDKPLGNTLIYKIGKDFSDSVIAVKKYINYLINYLHL